MLAFPLSTRSTITRTVVWVSIAFAMLALAAPLQADGHRARLSRGLAATVGAGRAKSVIVTGTPEQVRDVARRNGLVVEKLLESGAVLRVADAAGLSRLASDPAVPVVADDAPVSAHMATEVQALGADQAWSGLLGLPGVDGAGIGIAIIDSGITKNHESLKNRVVASLDFVTGNGRKGADGYGHGTHVAGIAVGSSTNGKGRFSGVAPGAHVVSLRVLDDNGQGTTSDVIAAIDWVIANRKYYGLRVVNLSLGKPVLESWVDDPLVLLTSRMAIIGTGFPPLLIMASDPTKEVPAGTPLSVGSLPPTRVPRAAVP